MISLDYVASGNRTKLFSFDVLFSQVTQSQNDPEQLKIKSTFSVNVSRSTTVRCVATLDLIANSSVPCSVTVLNNQGDFNDFKVICAKSM